MKTIQQIKAQIEWLNAEIQVMVYLMDEADTEAGAAHFEHAIDGYSKWLEALEWVLGEQEELQELSRDDE